MIPEGVHLACASAGSSAYSRAHNNKTLIIKIKRGGKEGKSGLSHDAMEQVRNPSNCQKAEGKKQKFKTSLGHVTLPQPTHYRFWIGKRTETGGSELKAGFGSR